MIWVLAAAVILILVIIAGSTVLTIGYTHHLDEDLRLLAEKHNALIVHLGKAYATNENVNEVRTAHNHLARLVTGMEIPQKKVGDLS